MPKNKSEKKLLKFFIKYRGMRRINEINKPAKAVFSTKIRMAKKFIKNTVTKRGLRKKVFT